MNIYLCCIIQVLCHVVLVVVDDDDNDNIYDQF